MGFQGAMPLPPKRIAPAGAPRRTALLILFTDRLGVGFAVRIEEVLAALLPRRVEFGRCDVPVWPAFLGNSAQILAEFFQSGPAEEPVAVVDLINDKAR